MEEAKWPLQHVVSCGCGPLDAGSRQKDWRWWKVHQIAWKGITGREFLVCQNKVVQTAAGTCGVALPTSALDAKYGWCPL